MPSHFVLNAALSVVAFASLVPAVTSHSKPTERAVEVQRYVVDNSKLQSKLGWLSYRSSMNLNDLVHKDGVTKPGVIWGSVVEGESLGDLWVKVGDRYLPKTIRGFPVLALEAMVSSEIPEAKMDKDDEPVHQLALATTLSDHNSAEVPEAEMHKDNEPGHPLALATTVREHISADGLGSDGVGDAALQGTQHGQREEVSEGGDAQQDAGDTKKEATEAGSGADEVVTGANQPRQDLLTSATTHDSPAVLAGAGSAVAQPAVRVGVAAEGASDETIATHEEAEPQIAPQPAPASDYDTVESSHASKVSPVPSERVSTNRESAAMVPIEQTRPRTKRFMQSSPSSDAASADEALPVPPQTRNHSQVAMHVNAPPPPPMDNAQPELMAVPETDVFGDAPHSRGRHDILSILSALSTLTLWATVSVLVSVFYYYEKAHPPRLDPEGVKVQLHERERLDKRRWRFGLFECGGDTAVCASSFLCAPVRWADTMRMAGLLQFFVAIALIWSLVLVGFVAFYLGLVLLLACLVHYRQRIRLMFDIPSGTLQSVAEDVMAYLCCCPCAVAQEARQLEEAYLARHPAVHRPILGVRPKQ